MIDFKQRSLKKEILDQSDIPFKDIERNLKELEWINSHLGGHAVTINGLKNLIGERKVISVCEIGCGGGDNLNAIDQYCKKNNIEVSLIAIDINNDCIAYAKTNVISQKVDFIVSDYSVVDFQNAKPDIIFSSLFCHHFRDDQLVQMLAWMNENASVGFFISDLHRHPLAYHFIKITSKIFSKSYLVKNDAPLSVLRGFKKIEWQQLLRKASLENASVKWRWAFRYLVTSEFKKDLK
ncbi:MAG: methyltransferase domain-containing protein [Ginsengibacter sp.]|jgi:2-polyprenyl-3-methyl-5-hydroxy-6-metoxy-1,4-benzoquinol methylase